MTGRVFHAAELEAVALYWRILRRDGCALGFTSHDRDLWLDGLLHRAAPGMVPSALRQGSSWDDDSADVEGVLSHDSITASDLAEGRYDGASITIGVLDWETGDHAALYSGTMGEIGTADGAFTAQIRSAKTLLLDDPVPVTSPLCRAQFCGDGCALNPQRFTAAAILTAFDETQERLQFSAIEAALYVYGELAWLSGPLAGTRARIVEAGPAGILLDRPLREHPALGDRARLRQGCDRTLVTCSGRFGNAINFRGEPYLPGNDFVARYPTAP